MKIILHIGTFKTGSTALQHHLYLNKDFLLENGYYYGNLYQKIKTHSNLTYGLLREALIHYGIFEKYARHPRFLNVAEKPNELIMRMVHDSGGKDIIISSEALYADSYITMIGVDAEKERVYDERINAYIRKRLREILGSYTSEIQIVCYLRRQDLFMESLYNQSCKEPCFADSKVFSFEKFLGARKVHLDYQKELSEWAYLFGKSSITVKRYESELLRYGLIRDFYETILGVRSLDGLRNVSKQESNRGMNKIIAQYKVKLGYTNPLIDDVLQNKISIGENKKLSDEKRGYFSNSERYTFLKTYEESNRVTARKFLGEEVLFVDPIERLPKVDDITYEQFKEITKELIKYISTLDWHDQFGRQGAN